MTLALGIPSDFLNDRTKLWRAFLDAGKSTFHLASNEQNVCGKRWTTRVFLLSVINFGFCQSGRFWLQGVFLVLDPSHRILIDAFSNLIFVIVRTVHFPSNNPRWPRVESSSPLFSLSATILRGLSSVFLLISTSLMAGCRSMRSCWPQVYPDHPSLNIPGCF